MWKRLRCRDSQSFQWTSFIGNIIAIIINTNLPSILQPLFTSHFLLVFFTKPQPPLSTCTPAVRVCEPPKGIAIAYAITPCPQLRGTSRFFFLRLPMFDLTVWARKTTTCTIAPRTEKRLRNLKFSCVAIVLTETHSWSSKAPSQTQFTHSTMDNIRRFKYSCISGVGFRHSVSTLLV